MNIAIWGAGKFGTYVGRQLIGKQNVVCYIDNNVGNRNKLLNTKIISPDEYMIDYDKNTDIVLVAVLSYGRIYEQIRKMKIEKFGIISRAVYEYHLDLSDHILNDVNVVYNTDIESKSGHMKTLETNVVDYCNLNCKGCSHFSNIFHKGATVGYESFEKDITCLSQKIFIEHFDLLGGEAFLAENLAKYVECLRKYMPKTTVTIVSNGILIPRQSSELLSYIRDNHVIISITQYPPTVKLGSEIRNTLDKYGIVYELRNVVGDFGRNIDLTGENDPYKAQTQCRESGCRFLRNGKIYKCPFSALGSYFFEYYNIPLHFEEGVDIYDEAIDWEHALNSLGAEPIELCRYCGKEERFTWEVSNKPACSEWIVKAESNSGNQNSMKEVVCANM